MAAPQYTTCVNRHNYHGLDMSPEIWAAVVSLVVALFQPWALVVSLYIVIEALMKICEYLLHGKLVCLDGNRCAIGHVTSFETVDDKDGFEKIDNDFCINMLLAPWDLPTFTTGTFDENYQSVIEEKVQGWLISEQPDMPMPMEPSDGKKYSPYYTEYPDKSWIDYNSNPYLQGIPYKVPVLHLEIEGERIHMVCGALKWPYSWIPGMDEFCHWKPLGIPIGRWVCAALSTFLAPLILPALAAAWAAGSEDNRSFEGAGSLSRGDQIIAIGRWVYDAGHSGYNELHPLLSLQKVADDIQYGTFAELYDRWCKHASEAPPPVPAGMMTPEQQETYDAQRQPENRWYFHPLLDGCRKKEEAPPPAVLQVS